MGAQSVGQVSLKKPRLRKSNKLYKELTTAEKQKFGASGVATLFAKLNSELNEAWEDYIAINFYLLEAHNKIKSTGGPRVNILRLVSNPRAEPVGASAIYGIISRIRTKTSARHAFIDAISLFEHFMSMLVFKVYLDFPEKLKGLSQQDDKELEGRRQKLIEVIFESADRHEMVHKLVEEKVRGIFYGNPSDLFVRNKANIRLGDHFKSNGQALIEAFKELAARRNIIIHNEGRVDRKYLLEVPKSPFKLGQIVPIDQNYLGRALLIMKDLAADSAQLVATNIYKEPLHGRAKKIQVAAKKRPAV